MAVDGGAGFSSDRPLSESTASMREQPPTQSPPPLPLDYRREPGKRIDFVRLLARVLTILVLLPIGMLCLYLALREPTAPSTGPRLFMGLCGIGFVGFAIGFIGHAIVRR